MGCKSHNLTCCSSPQITLVTILVKLKVTFWCFSEYCVTGVWCSVKKLFSKISQNSQERTWTQYLFCKVIGLHPPTSLKNRLLRWCFPVNFNEFLRPHFKQAAKSTDSNNLVTLIPISIYLYLDYIQIKSKCKMKYLN